MQCVASWFGSPTRSTSTPQRVRNSNRYSPYPTHSPRLLATARDEPASRSHASSSSRPRGSYGIPDDLSDSSLSSGTSHGAYASAHPSRSTPSPCPIVSPSPFKPSHHPYLLRPRPTSPRAVTELEANDEANVESDDDTEYACSVTREDTPEPFDLTEDETHTEDGQYYIQERRKINEWRQRLALDTDEPMEIEVPGGYPVAEEEKSAHSSLYDAEEEEPANTSLHDAEEIRSLIETIRAERETTKRIDEEAQRARLERDEARAARRTYAQEAESRRLETVREWNIRLTEQRSKMEAAHETAEAEHQRAGNEFAEELLKNVQQARHERDSERAAREAAEGNAQEEQSKRLEAERVQNIKIADAQQARFERDLERAAREAADRNAQEEKAKRLEAEQARNAKVEEARQARLERDSERAAREAEEHKTQKAESMRLEAERAWAFQREKERGEMEARCRGLEANYRRAEDELHTARATELEARAELDRLRSEMQKLQMRNQYLERQEGQNQNTRRGREARKAEEARRAEEFRKAREARQAEQARQAEEARKAEQARREAEAKQAQEDYLTSYDDKWSNVPRSKPTTPSDAPSFGFATFPWPVFPASPQAVNPRDITPERVKSFYNFRSGRIVKKSDKATIHAELLRFHPDKFIPFVLPLIVEADREKASAAAHVVAVVLADLLENC